MNERTRRRVVTALRKVPLRITFSATGGHPKVKTKTKARRWAKAKSPAPSQARLEVYQDHTQAQPRYRWRKVGANNRIVSVSGEGFDRRRYAALSGRRENPGVTRVKHLYPAPLTSLQTDRPIETVREEARTHDSKAY